MDSDSISIQKEMYEWVKSIRDSSSFQQPRREKPKIQRVPHVLKRIKVNQKCYEPLVVSLGPFHHGNSEFQRMEKLKHQMAHQFVMDSKIPILTMYDKVVAVIDEAKNCYDASAINGLSDSDFSKMMFLDGCFILQFLYMITSDQAVKNDVMKISDIAFVQRDLFLLENQVPFVVLDALMSSRLDNPYSDKIIEIISSKIRAITAKAPHPGNDRCWLREPLHLLDLARFQLIQERNRGDKGQKSASSGRSYSKRSANELFTSGIDFRPSSTQCFTDVRFESYLLSGTLWLPPLMVEDSTKLFLLNMVAYESCLYATDDFVVISYILLMVELINNAEDVKLLRSKGILQNCFGSDQKVVDLFKEIGTELVSDPDAYSLVKGQIEKHYKNKLNIWIAQSLHTFFSSPWNLVGLLAAIVMIGLMIIKTYFTVFPREG